VTLSVLLFDKFNDPVKCTDYFFQESSSFNSVLNEVRSLIPTSIYYVNGSEEIDISEVFSSFCGNENVLYLTSLSLNLLKENSSLFKNRRKSEFRNLSSALVLLSDSNSDQKFSILNVYMYNKFIGSVSVYFGYSSSSSLSTILIFALVGIIFIVVIIVFVLITRNACKCLNSKDIENAFDKGLKKEKDFEKVEKEKNVRIILDNIKQYSNISSSFLSIGVSQSGEQALQECPPELFPTSPTNLQAATSLAINSPQIKPPKSEIILLSPSRELSIQSSPKSTSLDRQMAKRKFLFKPSKKTITHNKNSNNPNFAFIPTPTSFELNSSISKPLLKRNSDLQKSADIVLNSFNSSAFPQNIQSDMTSIVSTNNYNHSLSSFIWSSVLNLDIKDDDISFKGLIGRGASGEGFLFIKLVFILFYFIFFFSIFR
jgi:hypothetical protein